MAAEWVAKRIGSLGRVITGKTPSTAVKTNFGGPFPFITIPDLGGRVMIDSTARTLSALGAGTIESSRLPPGSVLMSCIATVGKCGITVKPSFTNQQINALVPTEGVDARFLYYAFTQLGHELESLGGGGSVYTNVSKNRFADITVSLPVSVAEQQAIASILGNLDDKIELNRRTSAMLETVARALFRSWFVDFDPAIAKAQGRDPGLPPRVATLFPDAFEASTLGDVPQGWRVQSAYSIADVIYGAPFRSSLFNTEGDGKPLIRIRDLTTQVPSIYTPEVQPHGYLVRPGDLVVGMDGEFRAHLWRGPEAWLNQRLCCFKPRDGIPRGYVHYSIEATLDFFERSKTGTTVIHLGKGDIDTFNVLLPPMDILGEFGRLVDPLDARVVVAAQESRTLAALRDALLPKLVSGELRVPDAERIAVEAGA